MDNIDENEIILKDIEEKNSEKYSADKLEKTSNGDTNKINGDEDKSKKESDSLMEWIKSLGFAVIIALVIVKFVFGFTVVDGISMKPTLLNKDRLIEVKLDRLWRSTKRGDIVVIKDKVKTEGNYYVKRIVGLPGERVEVQNGSVFIDGNLLEEDYIVDGIYTEGNIDLTLGDDEYFVLGDNREPYASRDSRSFGPIKKKNIGGRCVFRVFPFNRFGILK
ncbi:MAG: signal peptidase I [Ezakiella sp.]|nr:signal peptidase I [Ezakiella sp.]MDD7472013.1 signal peptidase I [Bacillota bacterium]MDY3923977.1 signal peptidase I [Ezakiella sp.]